MVRADAIAVLDRLCKHHNMTKVDFMTYVIMGLAVQATEDNDALLSEGKIINLIISLGGKSEYPDGIKAVNDTLRKLARTKDG